MLLLVSRGGPTASLLSVSLQPLPEVTRIPDRVVSAGGCVPSHFAGGQFTARDYPSRHIWGCSSEVGRRVFRTHLVPRRDSCCFCHSVQLRPNPDDRTTFNETRRSLNPH